MAKKQNYLYGPDSSVLIPVNINFGDFFLRKLLERSDRVAISAQHFLPLRRQTSIRAPDGGKQAFDLANEKRSLWILETPQPTMKTYDYEVFPIDYSMEFFKIGFYKRFLQTHGDTGGTLTYGQIAQQGMNVAVSLSHLGVRKGDTVAVCTENRDEFWGALLGIVCTGATFTPYNPGCTNVEMEHFISISKPSYIFCSPTTFEAHQYMIRKSNLKKIIVFGEKIYKNTLLYNDIAIAVNETVTNKTDIIIDNKLRRNVSFEELEVADVDKSDVVFIMYSSGTTGMPKGVMLEHYTIITTCVIEPLKFDGNLTLTVAPWYHAMGLIGNLIGFTNGQSFVTLPKFEVDLYQRIIEAYKIGQLLTPPPILVAIAKSTATYDMSSVKKIISGAAPLSKDVIDIIHKKFPNISGVGQAYGLTESSIVVSINEPIKGELKKLESVGKVIACTTVKIVDIQTRKVLGAYKEGEICVKGAMIMRGYVGKDRRDDFDEEGFLKTGDIGYYDEEGYLYIVDRLKELIKYKGYQVPPAEIEAILLQHEAVRDAGVVGLYDEMAGEVPVAFVVTQPGKTVTQKELQDYVAGKLSNPKRLRGGVRFISEIPKNPSGKILRKVLKVMARNGKSKL